MSLPVLIQQTLLIILTIFILFAIGGFALFFKRVFDSEKEFEEKEKKTLRNYKKVLLHAHKDAEKIITDAVEQSTELAQETRDMNTKITEEASSEVKQDITHLTEEYQNQVKVFYASLSSQMDQILSGVTQKTDQQMKEFIQSFSEKTIGTQSQLSQKADEAFAKLTADLETYKAEQMDRIKKDADYLVMKVSKDILGKTITSSDHEALLMTALEKAKKEGKLFV